MIDGECRGTAAMASNSNDNDLEREEEVGGGDDPAHPLLFYHNALEYLEELWQYLESKTHDHNGGCRKGLLGSLHHHVEQLEGVVWRERSESTNQQPTLYHFFNKKTELATGTTNASNGKNVEDHNEDLDHNEDDKSFSSYPL